MARALITGVTGQDGSYLAEHLLQLGYEVHGTVRTTSADLRASRIGHLIDEGSKTFFLHVSDLGDEGSLTRLIAGVQPDEVYNLAAQSHVKASFDQPVHTGDITGLGAVRLLEAVRNAKPDARFYQASSSEMFGDSPPPQSEDTPFRPRSPYAVAKVYAYFATVNYRESYDLHASSGILFNHESPRRGLSFVTRKITSGLARIKAGRASKLSLGNMTARRDWGHAKDYVKAMHLILSQDEPSDYVIGTGVSHSVQDFLEMAAAAADLDWQSVVEIDPALFRPNDVPHLEADSSAAERDLGWTAETSLDALVEEMVRHDIDALSS